MFPSGVAGVALLLLRLLVATGVVVEGTGRLTFIPSFWLAIALAILAISICLGFMTPYGAILCGLFAVRSLVAARCDNILQPFTAMMLCIILAMLGPGTYSLDSRIFGRQLLRLPSRNRTGGD
jgi:uncharacterized membrane protein YphA (DoxX/SURF4 family)